jgi:multidrug efflux pump subunit AcrB
MAGRDPHAARAQGLFSYLARHRTLANLLMALMLAAGVYAALNIRAQFFPDTVVSEVEVSVAWPGAGAEDVDRGIVQVLDPALIAVDGVTHVFSLASEGAAEIWIEFEPGRDLNRATEEVQAALDAVAELPEDAETPEVRRAAWRDQVTDVVITGPVGLDQLGRFADEMVGKLFAEGITRTTIRGLAAPQTLVEVPSVALYRHDLTMAEIAAAIAAEVRTAPAGEVADGAARVRAGAEARAEAELAAIVLRSAPDGTKLTLGDIATIRTEAANRGRAAYVGSNPAITIRVDRNDTGDAIRLQSTVEEVAAELQAVLPPGVEIDLVRARADLIAARLELLIDNALMGLGIVLVLLFLFLNARTALWVAAGIPVALLAGLAAMHVAGLTLNMISLFALILMVGVVVDDAIVVGEHADWRARVLREDPTAAAEEAARRMWLPVLASTLTTVIAFAGLIVIGGRFGDLIADIPFTVIAVLIASLAECFLILPNHMRHALASQAAETWYDWPSRQVNRGFGWIRDRLMRPAMRFVLWARYPVLAGTFLLLATQIALLQSGAVQFRFFDAPEQSSVSGNFAMLNGATRADAEAMMRELQRAAGVVAMRYEAEHGRNPVEFALAEVGGSVGRGLSGTNAKDPDLLGGLSLELIEPDDRPYSSFAFLADVQKEVRPHPLLEELSFRGGRFGPGGDAISVDLYGAQAETLKAAAEALKAALAPMPGVSALEDSLSYDKEELVLTLTPQGQALGFRIDELGRALRDRLEGIEAATYPDGPRTATIRVETPAGEMTADFLDRTLMRTEAGAWVPLADIVQVQNRSGFSVIERENGLRVVTVSGDVAADDPATANAVQAEMTGVILPQIEAEFGVASRLSGQAEQEQEFLSGAWTGFLLCLLGIYLCLAWVFASWARPLVVMAVIPFGLIGAVWGHYVWEVPMSMFSIVGLIGMAGIIINDSIVLVSAVDERAGRQSFRSAIVDAVADRLRPVFLTTATTVLGLAPLLYESSSQAIFLKPTVITLVYGLGFGMVLVLIVTPAVLAVQGDAGWQLRAFRRALRHRRLRLWVGGVAAAAAALMAGLGARALMAGEALAPALLTGVAAAAALSAVAALGLSARRALR